MHIYISFVLALLLSTASAADLSAWTCPTNLGQSGNVMINGGFETPQSGVDPRYNALGWTSDPSIQQVQRVGPGAAASIGGQFPLEGAYWWRFARGAGGSALYAPSAQLVGNMPYVYSFFARRTPIPNPSSESSFELGLLDSPSRGAYTYPYPVNSFSEPIGSGWKEYCYPVLFGPFGSVGVGLYAADPFAILHIDNVRLRPVTPFVQNQDFPIYTNTYIFANPATTTLVVASTVTVDPTPATVTRLLTDTSSVVCTPTVSTTATTSMTVLETPTPSETVVLVTETNTILATPATVTISVTPTIVTQIETPEATTEIETLRPTVTNTPDVVVVETVTTETENHPADPPQTTTTVTDGLTTTTQTLVAETQVIEAAAVTVITATITPEPTTHTNSLLSTATVAPSPAVLFNTVYGRTITQTSRPPTLPRATITVQRPDVTSTFRTATTTTTTVPYRCTTTQYTLSFPRSQCPTTFLRTATTTPLSTPRLQARQGNVPFPQTRTQGLSVFVTSYIARTITNTINVPQATSYSATPVYTTRAVVTKVEQAPTETTCTATTDPYITTVATQTNSFTSVLDMVTRQETTTTTTSLLPELTTESITPTVIEMAATPTVTETTTEPTTTTLDAETSTHTSTATEHTTLAPETIVEHATRTVSETFTPDVVLTTHTATVETSTVLAVQTIEATVFTATTTTVSPAQQTSVVQVARTTTTTLLAASTPRPTALTLAPTSTRTVTRFTATRTVRVTAAAPAIPTDCPSRSLGTYTAPRSVRTVQAWLEAVRKYLIDTQRAYSARQLTVKCLDTPTKTYIFDSALL